MKLPWKDPRYYDNSDGLWDFMPEIHRPGGERFLHDDYPYGLRSIPRTYTSFIFLDSHVIKGGTKHQFIYKNVLYAKPWPYPGESYKAIITFKDPVTGEKLKRDYTVGPIYKNQYYRIGARVSDDYRESIYGYIDCFPYVTYFPGLTILTAGTKKL